MDFALSAGGQAIVDAQGFVGQNVWAEKQPSIPGAPPLYQQLTHDANRLSVDFRFETGGAKLDPKALADVGRVAVLLANPVYAKQNVLLFGFADNQGGSGVNQPLSLKRAQAVAEQLTHGGCAKRHLGTFVCSSGRIKSHRCRSSEKPTG